MSEGRFALIKMESDSFDSETAIKAFQNLVKVYGWCTYFHEDEKQAICETDLYSKDINTFSKLSVSVSYWLMNDAAIYDECDYQIDAVSLEMNTYGSYYICTVRSKIRATTEDADRIKILKLKNPKAYHAFKALGALP